MMFRGLELDCVAMFLTLADKLIMRVWTDMDCAPVANTLVSRECDRARDTAIERWQSEST
jgi:hypothetical protein